MENVTLHPASFDRSAAIGDRYIRDIETGLFPGHVGFRIGGHSAGPNVVIAGGTKLTGAVYQRLLLLPTLSRLKGELFLLRLDRFDSVSGLDLCLPKDLIVDGQMLLPFVGVDDLQSPLRENAVKQAFWSVLRLCAEMGMIAGRGLPSPVRRDLTAWKAAGSQAHKSAVH